MLVSLSLSLSLSISLSLSVCLFVSSLSFSVCLFVYIDGFRVDNVHVADLTPISVFYPVPWLESVGYFGNKKPDLTQTQWSFVVHPPTLSPQTSSVNTATLMEANNEQQVNSENGWSNFSVFMMLLISIIISSYIAFQLGKANNHSQYVAIQQYEHA